ncbi:hypothetical protein CBQ26_20745 [Deinococcus indicus]|uniref:Antitoxin Xre/MbcA/ParS-like toxin-binding domain-containing protein n=1 Tax=Deinococcus indicus TaxID=223556 RepID=A0A246BDL1_9DEIO|nr:hypothetical protein [Deinococcus indicus]OWL93167.1 hypothetical protein CBQ26_20745 [Deinococcus indicus]
MTRGTSSIPATRLAANLHLLATVGLTTAQQVQLLGLDARAVRLALRTGLPLPVSPEQQQRIRSSVEIAQAVHVLYNRYPERWFTRENNRPPFDGQTPLAYVLAGGTAALVATHRSLLADLNGLFSTSLESRALAGSLPQPDIEVDASL